MTSQQYNDYISSQEWDTKRKEKLREQGYQCEECGAEGIELHVHHLTYSNLGNEHLSDLQVLCIDCHRESHDHFNDDWYY